MNQFRHLTITTKLTLLFILFATLILIGVGTLSYFSRRAALEQAVISDLESTANEKQAALDHWLEDRLNLVVSITGFPAYRTRVNSLIHDNLDAAARKSLQSLTAQTLAGFTGPAGNYAEMMIVDAHQGQIIVSTQPENQGKFNEDRPYYIEGLKGPFVQNIVYSISERAPIQIVAAPIKADDGSVIAVLAARLKLDEMNEIILRRTGQRSTDDAFLVDPSNLLITQPRFLTDPAVLQRGVHTEPVNRCLTGSSGVIEALDYRDVPVLAVYRWMPERQKCLIVKIDQAEAFAPSNTFGQTMALIGIATMVLASLLGFGLAHTITNPLRVLQDGVVRFGRGERDVRLPETARDEIGVLSHEFNQTASRLEEQEKLLRSYSEDLEQKVEQRTQALRESEERYRGLFEHMVEGYAFCQLIYEDGIARDFIYLEVNEAFGTLTGLKDVIGKRVSEVIPGIQNSDPELFARYSRVSLSGKPEKFEIFVESLTMWFLVSVYSPRKEYFVAVFDVITERKQAEAALLASEARYHSTLDAMLEGCQIIGFDWKYLYLNDAADRHNRRPKEELLGKKYMDMWPDIEKTQIFSTIELCLQERQSQTIENQFIFPDGRIGWFELRIYPVPEGVVILSIDITERKQVEEVLLKSEERYRTVADYTYDWEYWRAPDGMILYMSPSCERITGYPVSDFIEDSGLLEKIIHPADQILYEEHKYSIDHDQDILKVHEVDYRILRRDGGERWIGHSCQMIYRADGTNLGRRATNRDITERKQAEQALRNSEQLYRAIGESIDYGVWICDPDGRNIYASESFLKLVGLTQEQCSNFGWGDVLHPDDEDRTLAAWQECVRTGNMWDIEHRFRGVDGRWHPILARGVPIRNEQDEITAWAGINLDISQLTQYREALQTALNRFQRMVDSNIIGIITAKADGSILEANDYYLGMIGYTQADLKAGLIRWTDITPPEYLYLDDIALRELADRGSCTPYEKQYIRRDGTRMWVLLADTMLPGPEGEIAAFALDISIQKSLEANLANQRDELRAANEQLAQDLIERKRVEKEIQKLNADLELRVQERTAELSDLYNNAPCGYHSLDRDATFLRINDTELNWLGYSREELVGKMRVTDLLTPESLQVFGQNFPVFKELGWLKDLELHFIRKDGSILPVLISATAIRDKEGIYQSSRTTMIDYSALKQAEEAIHQSHQKLEVANRELETFAYSVSHDLRAPLRGIDGWSLALLEDNYDQLDGKGKEYIERVRFETQRMGQLIDDLLQLSRVTRSEMQISPIDMSNLVQTVVARLVSAQPERKVEITIQPGLIAFGDSALVSIVLTNLFDNAWKFTSKKEVAFIEFGQIAVDGESPFYVRDNGAGFDMAHATKLFGAFQRLHKASEYPGTGVGLATVQRIIHRHGGRIWVEASVARGATFFFTLEEKG